MFAVVDVETTGGHASGHGMTEIAIVLHDGIKVVDHYSSLLNPRQHIPLSIQTLTGITPDMVEDAPPFEEVAQQVHQFLGNHIFVAHNVNFDFAFVRSALGRCGIDYNPKRLCSVRYARRLEKGLRSYSLPNLCKHFNVKNPAAHRAWGDAMATTEILSYLFEKDVEGQWQYLIKKNSGEFNLPAHLPSKDYHDLPEKPGVYYFLDQTGKPIYIGKARNLKKRVATHFISDKETKRSQAFKREIHRIEFELTGSELLASLLEDHEIRHHWPRYNRAQKKPKKKFAVYAYENQKGTRCLAVNKVTVQNGYLKDFHTQHDAIGWVHEMLTRFQLNPAYCGFPHSELSQDRDPDRHNQALLELMASLERDKHCCVIKTPGREEDEDGFAYIDQGHLAGIGFVQRNAEIREPGELKDYLRPLGNSITTQSILDKVLEEGRYKVLRL